jgi:hypothetical protein
MTVKFSDIPHLNKNVGQKARNKYLLLQKSPQM